MNTKVRVSFSANRSGKIPIMGSDIKIELSLGEISGFDGQVLMCRFTLNLYFDEIQAVQALHPNFDPDNVFPCNRLCKTLQTKVYNAFPLRFPPSYFDSPASPVDSYPTSQVQELESGSYIVQAETAAPLVRLNATSIIETKTQHNASQPEQPRECKIRRINTV